MEYQADEKGTDICLLMYIKLINSNIYNVSDCYIVAPFLATAIMSLFGDSESNTHPSATMRKNKIKEKFEFILSDGKYKVSNSDYAITKKNISKLMNVANDLFIIFKDYQTEVIKYVKDYKNPDNSWNNQYLNKVFN